jgi:hypothetical protein
MKTIVQQTTFIPNQQKSSFTNYRNVIVMNLNNMIDNNNKTIKNQSELTPNISNDFIKNRKELNQLLNQNGLQTIGNSIIKKHLKK